MSSYKHTPWQNAVTEYKASDMNAPLGQLDQVIYDVSGEVYNLSGEIQTGVHDFYNKTTGQSQLSSNDEVVIYDTSSGEYRSVTLSDLNDTGGEGVGLYDMGIFWPSTPGNSQEVCRYPMPRAVRIPAAGGSSRANAGTAATGSTVFSLKKDGVQFQTCTFAASGTTGTFSGESTDFVAGEVFTLVGPASADSTLADIGFAIAGVRL